MSNELPDVAELDGINSELTKHKPIDTNSNLRALTKKELVERYNMLLLATNCLEGEVKHWRRATSSASIRSRELEQLTTELQARNDKLIVDNRRLNAVKEELESQQSSVSWFPSLVGFCLVGAGILWLTAKTIGGY